MTRIGYQGDLGSNAEEAAWLFASELAIASAEFVPLVTSAGVANALIDRSIDYGVWAISNSIAGDVAETDKALRAAQEKECSIVPLATKELHIHHYLFALNESAAKSIDAIASHEQALAQTARYRARYFPSIKAVATIDTAIAAKMLASGELPAMTAIICRRNAGEVFGFHLVAENIEDEESITRFQLVAVG